MEFFELWDLMVDYGIATNEEIALVTDILGRHNSALNDIIFARTGYRSIDQIIGEIE